MAIQTPLYQEHLKLSAKMVEYAGFMLPVQYPAGISAEHLATRQIATVFDVSHMGELSIQGRDTYAFLDALLPRDLSRIDDAIGRQRALYSVLCAEDGTVVDDLLIYPLAADKALLVVNAANTAADEQHIRTVLDDWLAIHPAADVQLANVSAEWAQIALQGPGSADILRQMVGTVDFTPALGLGRYRFLTMPGTDGLIVSRTGYTGEDGYEFYLPPQSAAELWQQLLAAGAQPAGLGARDTLRLEAGMPLYGHELSRSITPREAGLDRFLALDKPAFVGRDRLLAEPARTLVGLVANGKAIPRADYPVLINGLPAGHVTSGTYSPSLGRGIAMALVDRNRLAQATDITIEIRGRAEPFERHPLPFV